MADSLFFCREQRRNGEKATHTHQNGIFLPSKSVRGSYGTDLERLWNMLGTEKLYTCIQA
jgi:hypothetical protein